jgi:hypothetical protein
MQQPASSTGYLHHPKKDAPLCGVRDPVNMGMQTQGTEDKMEHNPGRNVPRQQNAWEVRV